MTKAVFPGSFDPPTYAHLDIIERAASIFERLIVLVAENRKKEPLLKTEERAALLQNLLKEKKNVSVAFSASLTVDFMKKEGCRVLVRGARTINDFLFEQDLFRWNSFFEQEIETVLFFPRERYAHFSSSAVKELLAFGKDISVITPPEVQEALKNVLAFKI
ncbi:MAG: pantetheine-phosphate adenylyltransferase [Spirochaetaceae bacterium]|jgi:pantetheine-phosphate adenylyltransferase|nr:pantetheine-phosphate adenylyltransferase [Spirochaetaceae bacterium]